MAPGDASNKRKRGGGEFTTHRPSPALRGAASAAVAAASAAAAAAAQEASAPSLGSFDESALRELIAHNSQGLHNGGQPSVAETAQAALTHYQVPASFESNNAGQGGDHNGTFATDSGFLEQLKEAGQSLPAAPPPPPHPHPHPHASQSPSIPVSGGSNLKPAVGSDEWHRIRRDNHKEVERRRREAINEGITELAKIVPGCEKNKGSILQRAVAYIGQLKENEQKNIEKWTLEKLLLDQAITELGASGDRLKADLNYVSKERDIYRTACEENNISVDLKELDDEHDTKAASEE